ncbi:MAG: heavy-metal-associated domain-containing protein [Rubrivivax sp.]|nr:heavy-metal-associated domain-containing protein [Rubrivivax sp.]
MSDNTARASLDQATVRIAHLVVPGMGSDHCAGLVTTSIKRLPGVADVGTNIGNHRVAVGFDS